MNDSVDDVDHEGNGSSGARTSNYVRARYDTVRMGCLVEERPRKAGPIHRVEVDHTINSLCMRISRRHRTILLPADDPRARRKATRGTSR